MHGLTAGGLAPIKMKEDSEWSMMVGAGWRRGEQALEGLRGPKRDRGTVDELWVNDELDWQCNTGPELREPEVQQERDREKIKVLERENSSTLGQSAPYTAGRRLIQTLCWTCRYGSVPWDKQLGSGEQPHIQLP